MSVYDLNGNILQNVYDLSNKTVNTAYNINGNILQSYKMDSPQYIFHGGITRNGYIANTMPLFETGYSQGYRFMEADIRVTSDGIPVCWHDDDITKVLRNVDGTTVSDKTILISDSTLDELLTYNLQPSDSYDATKILKVDDLLDYCKENSIILMLDLTTGVWSNADDVKILYDLVSEKGMIHDVVWCGGNTSALQKLNPSMMYEVETGNIESAQNVLKNAYVVILGSSSYATLFTSEFISNAHNVGLYTDAWTIDNQDTADELFANGCDFVITNTLLNSSIKND